VGWEPHPLTSDLDSLSIYWAPSGALFILERAGRSLPELTKALLSVLAVGCQLVLEAP
jgi:hypothetical protein